jgi:riboflavin kinase / FMN adenylyltransferase
MTTRIFHGLPTEPLDRPSYLTIGNFDGVHRGHQALVEGMLAAAHADGCQAGVLTFDPHPLAVLRPEIPLAYLTTREERIDLLSTHGLDFVVVLPFTRATAATTAPDFMRALVDSLRLQALWVGPDFALGRGREGTPDRLAELGTGLGYTVHQIQPFEFLGGPVHSSRIRGLIGRDGAVDQAAVLLGRPYRIAGPVTRGAGRGRKLGYPTANIAVAPGRLVPAFGIYACWAWIEDRGHPAATSIGVRPTFDNGAPSIEAYLLDFDDDLYDEVLGLSFVKRLRPEQKFPSVDALIAQMDRDVDATRRILGDPPDDAGTGTAKGNGATAGAYWEEIRHTADWAVRVEATTQRQLFARAGHVMFELQEAEFDRPATLARSIEVQGDDTAELLVAWLNHLLLCQEVWREMYTRFAIHDLSPTGLRATAYGYEGAPSHTEIKAVTYWNLAVTESAAGWTATITFDV